MTLKVEKIKDALEHLEENGPSERYKVNDASKSIVLKKDRTFNGQVDMVVKQIGDGSIIKLFDKTPFPEKPDDVVCPHFLELKWANGCYFDCAWCYLKGTFRFLERGMNPYLKDPKIIIESIEAFFDQWEKATILNSGELSDSLVFEGYPFSLSKDIIPLFKKQDIHKLLIVTKSSNVKGILESESQDVVIPSFSINAYPVAERWENRTPHPHDRIRAAKKLFEEGYEVRIRLDPMVPVEGWIEAYKQVIDNIFKYLYPERITLGSLRGLQNTINNCEETSWVEYLKDGRTTNWGKKIADDIRYDLYKTLINHLEDSYFYNKIALCKETVTMWKKLNLKYKNIKCNCLL